MQAVVLLSGGLDSYTAAAIARADGFTLNALTIFYGQRHAREVDAARAVAKALGVPSSRRHRRRRPHRLRPAVPHRFRSDVRP